MFKHSAEHTWVTDEWLWEWLVNIQIPLPPALRDVISMMGKKKKKKGKVWEKQLTGQNVVIAILSPVVSQLSCIFR